MQLYLPLDFLVAEKNKLLLLPCCCCSLLLLLPSDKKNKKNPARQIKNFISYEAKN
jgi:hypothetical protein